MKNCSCGSMAINPNKHGRDNSLLDLCDVCFWKKKYEQLLASSHDNKDKQCYRCGKIFKTWDQTICGDCDQELIEATKRDQDKKTRHAIAEKVEKILSRYDDASIGVGLAEEMHRIIMNCNEGLNKQ